MKIFIILLSIGVLVSTPLDDYVNTPDPFYKYELIQTYHRNGYTLYVLNMTSQKWLNETYVDRPIWWHYLSITVPVDNKRSDAALLWIGEGSNNNKIPMPEDYDIQLMSNFSLTTRTISANLQQVPNQPLIFKDDPLLLKRSEDALIAWGWKKFLDNPTNPQVLPRLPMTKSVIKAMDTVEDFIKKTKNLKIKKFMVAGKSKRGWTTWLTAALDPKRVFSAVPIVMDLLNINTNLHQNFKALGGWTFAFSDYYQVNITRYLDTREIFEMQKIIDPLYYLDRFRDINFLVVSTTGDEFFFPDNTHSYWENLVAATDGRVLHRRIPNIGHSIQTIGDTVVSLLKGYFISSYYQSGFIPKLTWTRPNNSTHGILKATVELSRPIKLRPFNVFCWYTQTNLKRDFRRAALGPSGVGLNPVKWVQTQDGIQRLDNDDQVKFSVAFERPLNGWLGFFLEFEFPGLQGSSNVVTTEVNIVPEFYPNEDCTRSSCLGKLV